MSKQIQREESEYTKKLRDPRWQRKRLEIMQRDDFTCHCCYENHKTLHVHHTHYVPGRDPWEYPGESLATLCEDCHREETEMASTYREDLVTILAQRGCFWREFQDLCAAFLHWAGNHPQVDTTVLKWAITTPEVWNELRERYFAQIRERDPDSSASLTSEDKESQSN